MKALLALGAAALLAAGCAADPAVQVARNDCKVAPVTTASAVGKTRPVSEIDRRAAQMDLARSQYRFSNLARNGPDPNLVEDALRDCR